MSDKLLSICIPTHNRARYLKECLDSIAGASRSVIDEVELVISDNASTDETASVAAEYAHAFRHFRYHRQENNIGGERNFRAVASMASGEYVWVFGDDDLVEPHAITTVLRHLRAGYSFLLLNYSVWTHDFRRCLRSQGQRERRDIEFDTPDALLARFGIRVGYISSVVVARSVFLRCPQAEYDSLASYGFPFLYAVFTGLGAGNCRARFMAEPMVRNRSGNSGNYDWYRYFVTGSSLIFDALRTKGYSNGAVRLAKRGVIRRYVIPDILVRKRDKVNTKGLFNLMLPHYKKDPLFWIGVVPALLVPEVVGHLMWRVAKAMKRLIYQVDR